MGGEEEIVRIAKRLDKMVAKKSAVSPGRVSMATWPPGVSPSPVAAWGGGPAPMG